jgi:hypothetical protein
VSPVKYELGFYIPEDDILHSHCRENLKFSTQQSAGCYTNREQMVNEHYTSLMEPWGRDNSA